MKYRVYVRGGRPFAGATLFEEGDHVDDPEAVEWSVHVYSDPPTGKWVFRRDYKIKKSALAQAEKLAKLYGTEVIR
jgi:hypothetical protein